MSLIEVSGLKKSFGSLEVLKGIDLNVEEGEHGAGRNHPEKDGQTAGIPPGRQAERDSY